MNSIEKDANRFKKIVKGKVRDNLKQYINHGERIAKKGKDQYSVPMPSIDIPRFKFGSPSQGVGQGEGKPGQGKGEKKPGQGEAGDTEGNKELDVDFSADELAEILGSELELPRIEPKGEANIEKAINRYKSLGMNGPNSLKHMKKTYFQALKRQISNGKYDPNDPVIIPIKKDYRYRTSVTEYELDSSATIFYIMDVSGSMGDEQKEIVRNESFWLNMWLKVNYKNVTVRYIIHDSTAKEVDENTFFQTKESGGTLISSAYHLMKDIIEKEKISSNIYMFQFSDGDNWSGEDTDICLNLLESYFIPICNLVCYGQVESRYGSGQYYKELQTKLDSKYEEVILSQIKSKEDIMKSIKEFLGKGK